VCAPVLGCCQAAGSARRVSGRCSRSVPAVGALEGQWRMCTVQQCSHILPPRWQSLRLAAPPWAPGPLPYWRTHAHLHDNSLVNHKRIGWGHRDRDRGPAARQRQAARLGVKFAAAASVRWQRSWRRRLAAARRRRNLPVAWPDHRFTPPVIKFWTGLIMIHDDTEGVTQLALA